MTDPETWTNVDTDCPLCVMEKQTEWYYEDEKLVVADNLQGKPFVVWKSHLKKLDAEQLEYVDEIVTDLFGDHDRHVLMNIVEDHWHAHIRDYETHP